MDFFTANIRNPNSRAAYAVAVRAFFVWLESKHVAPLAAVRTHHVSAYVERLTRTYRAPTVKQHLAAIRMLFDWLIVGQVVGLTRRRPCAAPSMSSKRARRRFSTATRRRNSSTASTFRRSLGCATER